MPMQYSAVLKPLKMIFSSPERKAHGSAYRIPMLRRSSVVRRASSSSTISNISKTACPIKGKFYVEPPMVKGNESFAASGSHDQDGREAHIW